MANGRNDSTAKTAVIVFILLFFALIVLFQALQQSGDNTVIRPFRPIPSVPDYDRDAVQPDRPDEVDKQYQGWVPDPEGTRQFLRELGNRAQLLQAGPDLTVRDNEPAYLYRALYKAYETYRPGQKWIVGKQGIGDCFVKDTLVTMADGTEKPIQDIVIGDYVLSHTGRARRVTNTFQRKYSGELVTIRVKTYAIPVTATAEHKFVTYPGIPCGRGSGNSYDATPAWREIGKLKPGDRVLLSRVNIAPSKANDVRWCRLIGLFLAEGGFTKYANGLANRIELSLGRHEHELIADAVQLLREAFGGNVIVAELPSKPSVSIVRLSHTVSAQALQRLVPGNVYTKAVPADLFAYPQNSRLAAIRGWMDGDGHTRLAKTNGGYSFQVQGTSASLALLRSMHRLALSCDLKPSLRVRKQYENRAASGDLYLFGESALTVFPERREEVSNAMSKRGLQITNRSMVDDGIAAPVTEISRRFVENETVFDITVEEEHSFIANGYGVHNCVSWAYAHGADVHLAVMFSLGDTSEWIPAATEAIYGGSRVEARGRKTAGYVDGSYGGAAARWLINWGALFRQAYQTPAGLIDLSQYSASRAKEWGNFGNGGQKDSGYLDAAAKKHPVRDIALVKTFREAAAAIQSGYPVAVCSNQGFSRTRDENGFARPVGNWAHAMCFVGVRFDRPGLLCLNSWGPSWNSGPKHPADMPDGSFWVDAKTCDSMLGRGDSFAISGYDGFPYRELRHDQWVLNIQYTDHLYALAP